MMKVARKKNNPNNNLKALAERYIIKTSENFRGLSYSDVIIIWQRWLLSDNPDQNQWGDIFFLRGSIGFHKSNFYYLKSSAEISFGDAILVPIITTHFNIGERYDGKVITDEYSLRMAVREHVDAAGPFWATLQMNYNPPRVYKLVSDLELFRIESMLFELNVSKKNPFLERMDERNYPGKHMALVAGYFVLLQNLPPLSYKIRFGGYGMDGFYSESLYEIIIKNSKKNRKDLSGPNFTPQHLIQEKKIAIS
jgi:hypothetical protein